MLRTEPLARGKGAITDPGRCQGRVTNVAIVPRPCVALETIFQEPGDASGFPACTSRSSQQGAMASLEAPGSVQ